MTDKPSTTLVYYPESDGQPMTESDATRDSLTYCVEALQLYFQGRRNVYVSGNMFIYYEKGNNRAVVSPDVFVVFGVGKRKRRTYKTWLEDNILPSFVLEVTSLTTKKQDEIDKPKLYASLGVQEYFQYDPTADYLNPQLKGSRLVDGSYQPMPLQVLNDGTPYIYSQVLGLDLRLQVPNPLLSLVPNPIARDLRLYDPQSGAILLNYREMDQARSEAEQARSEAEQARLEAEQARLEAIPRLLEMGLTSEQIAIALNLAIEEVQLYQATSD
ncbi:MAG: Uma2 family endonuclease [Oculatellaceae cyanobacterium Prado106]|jgi:Uma2 family endonuclease|nr:Uma2 family endonuclease [Oculatellaceae cyanobacterium Prado106]